MLGSPTADELAESELGWRPAIWDPVWLRAVDLATGCECWDRGRVVEARGVKGYLKIDEDSYWVSVDGLVFRTHRAAMVPRRSDA